MIHIPKLVYQILNRSNNNKNEFVYNLAKIFIDYDDKNIEKVNANDFYDLFFSVQKDFKFNKQDDPLLLFNKLIEIISIELNFNINDAYFLFKTKKNSKCLICNKAGDLLNSNVEII